MLTGCLLLVAALINLAPLLGLFSVVRMENAYGIDIAGADLAILLQHRALLFGIVGGIMLMAVFSPPLRPLAYSVGLISMLGFIVIAWTVGAHNSQLARIMLVDWIGIVCLLLSLSLSLWHNQGAGS